MMAKHKTPSDSGVDAGPAIPRRAVFARTEELQQLRKRFAARQSFLLHGPAGVGKTRLLLLVCRECPEVLYSPQNPAPQLLYRNLSQRLLFAGHPVFRKACPNGISSLQAKTAVSVRGLLREALRDPKYFVVVDHLLRPSQALAAALRELMNWEVPVVAVSRSAHMEDAGFVAPLFPDRGERFALRNFEPETARVFAAGCADAEGLKADNRPEFTSRVAEFSQGNPGAILQMIHMAAEPKYSAGNRIKITPLYIDYKIASMSESWEAR
jgi:AAA ATPase domain